MVWFAINIKRRYLLNENIKLNVTCYYLVF